MIGALTVSVKYQDDVFEVFLKDFTATNQHCYEADKERYWPSSRHSLFHFYND